MNAGLIWAVIFAVRLVLWLTSPKRERPLRRAEWSAGTWAFLVWVFCGIPGFALIRFGEDGAQLVGMALLVPVFPWALARWIAIPAGLVRTSYVLAAMANVTWRRDRRGGSVLAAAWALSRRHRTSERTRAWVDARLAAVPAVRGASVVATGLVAARAGDVAGAIALFQSVEALGPSAVPAVARMVAREWLAAHAAEAGDFGRVAALTAKPGPRSRVTLLLREAAIGITTQQGSGFWLIARWLLTPRHYALWPIVEHALACLKAPLRFDDEDDVGGYFGAPHHTVGDGPYRAAAVDLGGDRLGAALDRHIAILRDARGPSAARLRTAIAAWDAALRDPTVRRLASERAYTLGVDDPDRALAAVTGAAQADLAAIALAAELPLLAGHDDDSIGSAVARRVREDLLDDVEAAARVLEARIRSERLLPTLDEWREVVVLRAAYERAGRLGGIPLRRLTFQAVHDAACPLAVRLWNKRGQRALANAIFTWLHDEAEAVGNAHLATHEKKNVSCGI